MPIKLSEIMTLTPSHAYKVHFARWNQKIHPLEAYARNFDTWRGWQEYRPAKDEFNRDFIFSLMQVYYETDSWLFGVSGALQIGYPTSTKWNCRTLEKVSLAA